MQGWQDRFQESDLADICSPAARAGINFYDTAEVGLYAMSASGDEAALWSDHATVTCDADV
jgi:hypothetical protein